MKVKTILIAASISSLLSAGDKIINYDCIFPKYASIDGLKKAKNFFLKFKIDTQSGKSYQEGNNGLSDVTLIYNESAKSVTFIEVTSGKNVMTTTIVPNGQAVHSRNTVMLGHMLPSQYYGTCSIK